MNYRLSSWVANAKCFKHIISFNFHKDPSKKALLSLSPILQMKKLRIREVNEFALIELQRPERRQITSKPALFPLGHMQKEICSLLFFSL